MLILQIWSKSKPVYGRYLYKGQVYTKSERFLDVEKNLYSIRYGLRILFCVMALFFCALRKDSVVTTVIFTLLHILLADVVTIPLYYINFSKILNHNKEKY